MSTVTGLVFDSVSHAPIAGAAVQIASRDSLNRLFAATSDAKGHFRIAGIPSGQYVIGFYHDALTALGLDAPVRMIELKAGVNRTVDLAVPSGAVVRALRCGGDSAERGDGMLAGFVRDAQSNDALAGAIVATHWQAIAVDSGHFHTTLERRTATVGSNGTYVLCDLPVDSPLEVRVSSSGRRVVAGELVVPGDGARRRDFHLGDSAVAKGPAIVSGRVESEAGTPIRSGRATISALGVDVPVQSGSFVMKGLPLGTWSLEVKALGLEPRLALIDLLEIGSTSVTITLTDHVPALEPVTVVGKPSRETEILRDALFRRRFGAGTVFMPGDSWLKAAGEIGDVLRAARGFHTNGGIASMRGRVCTTNGSPLKVYLNGAPYPLGLADLNKMIPIKDVMAIEAYPDGMSAPLLWRIDHPCAVLAVWTWTP